MKKDFDEFISTLTSSIKTWDFFVNWSKVNGNIKSLEITLNKLNFLLGKDDLDSSFRQLYDGNPEIVEALPVLLAVRESNLEIYDKQTKESQFYEFKSGKISTDEALEFVHKSGLDKLFITDGVKNLVDYVTGVEVGLDSNGRKNRGGKLMEEVVGLFLDDYCKTHDFTCMPQATATKIRNTWGISVNINKSERSFDYAIYDEKSSKLTLIEVNFYNGGGSKLKAVCGEFKGLYDELKTQNIEFIWITDGLGWHTSKRPLEEAYNHIDYLFNLKQLESGALSELKW